MATIVFAGATIGVEFALSVLASIGIGGLIGLAGAALVGKIGEELEKHKSRVKERIQNSQISSYIDSHVMTKKHKFNNSCNEQCILQVANNLKSKKSWETKTGVPCIEGTGNCSHGCEIEVRMSIPPLKQMWEIGTAFHKGICYAA